MTRERRDISQSIVNYLVENENELISKVLSHEDMSSLHDTAPLRDIFFQFLHRFQENLLASSSRKRPLTPLIGNIKEQQLMGNSVAVTTVIDGLYDMSKTIWTMFKKEAQDIFNLTADELLYIHDLLNKEIKYAVKEVLNFHVSLSNQKEEKFNEKLNELSVPIINVTGNTAICPLIGAIDESRGRYLLHETLQQCKDRKINRLIFDLSGVPKIDDIVASHLNLVIKSLDLIGVYITLTGVRSNIAMTVIQQDITFEKVSIKATVKQALTSMEIIKDNN
ncbi:STAS domain-containing protein [Salipaludibacillus aurantiacus]|uniref:Anti-anti-sigma regulatory factor (Antagonist of anti-sigma factor) n=1 Tax=Salipaludibacillus aurantiacus TaxID=1601833 RepID=A0A1H9RGT1_9BACI|nr:STAS domain-containing protein [Salipaludibacillus aurantiacus]SER72011.1 Anti-anti-sigma regulatory factor (antagonist of anti-sigma factor) [Salipaludibacillus aurantiacus]